MRDQDKTKEQLIQELTALRQRMSELETAEAGQKNDQEEIAESQEQSKDDGAKYIEGDGGEYIKEWAEKFHQVLWIRSGNEINYISPAYEELCGRSCQSLYENPDSFLESIHPDDKERLIQSVMLEREHAVPFCEEYRIVRPDGSIRWVLARIFFMRRDGQGLRAAGIVEDITQRKANEQILRESEEKFRLVTETIEDVFWMSTPGAKEILYVSPAYEKIWGRSIQSLPQHQEELIETIHPDDRELMLNQLKEHARGVATEFEYRIVRPDGSIRWIQNRGYPIRDTNGRIWKVAGISTDITERKRAEDELGKYHCHLEELVKERTDRLMKANEQLQAEFTERYRAEEASRRAYAELDHIFEGAVEGICIVDRDGKFLRANQAFCALVGRSRDDLIGRRCSDMFSCSLCEVSGCPISRILAGEESVEFEKEMKRSDGAMIPCLLTTIPFRGPKEELLGIVTFFKDIRGWKKTEELLRESESKYSALVEQAQDGVAIVQDGLCKFANTATARITGYPVEELTGMRFRNLIAPESRELAAWIYTLRLSGEKAPSLFEAKLACKDGGIKYGEISSSLIQYHGKSGLMAIIRDVTDRKRIEEEKGKIHTQLIQAQKMEAVGLLAGGVAHDFNNLLTMIQGHATLALLEVNEADPITMDLKEIRTAAGRAANLTRQLLLFSSKQPNEPVSLNLNATINELLKMIHRVIGEDITIKVDLKPDLWTVLADEGNVEQVIMNLTTNARDAMPKGGELAIRTKNLTLDAEQATLIPDARAGQFVCLTISDTGCGMSRDVMTRIFEPFFTTKEVGKGSGLGLSVIYGIVRQHEGWVHVSSTPGQGTSFAVSLPASFISPETKFKEVASVKKFQGKGEHILLVEDEKGVRKLTSTILRENGYRVLAAENAMEALSIFGQERGNFDLLLSDVVLPDQSALELADQLLLLHPALRVLLVSGYPDKQSQLAVIQERGFRLLHKPVPMVELLRAMREIIEPAVSCE